MSIGQWTIIGEDTGLRGEIMAYSELVKNFNRIREYMREFYVYGFKSRDEYTGKSARSYDDERRRLESWLGDYMRFRQTPDGKNVFISIDSRVSRHNPLYKAWKAKSFTDGDITLHFILMDILAVSDTLITLGDITSRVDARGLKELILRGIDSTYDSSISRYEFENYSFTKLKAAYKQRTGENFDEDDFISFSLILYEMERSG